MKDNRTLLLGLLSFGLIGTWVYHFYDKSHYTSNSAKQYSIDSLAVAGAMRDSLQEIYTATITKLDTQSNVDSIALLKGELGEKMREINTLKNNIGNILRKKKISSSDLTEARGMVKELRQKIAAVQSENATLAEEKDKMNNILEMLNKEMIVMQMNLRKVTDENKQMSQTLNNASTLMASELRLAAMNLRSEEKEVETNSVKKADKFVVSFVVQNNVIDIPGAELVIAIKEPSGRIMIGEGWNAGTFDTKDGRKEYTRRVRFEYTRGEQKRLIFSVQTETFQKGTYKMNVYHNGVVIGEASWMLG